MYSQASISLNNLRVYYKDVNIFDNFSGTFKENTLTAITGPNGSGKTTLLNTIIGFHVHFQGSIQLNGLSPSDIAYLPQMNRLDRNFPICVKELVAMGFCNKIGFFKQINKNQQKKVDEALDQVGMLTYKNSELSTLSGGQFQKTLFARTIIQDCKAIFLDEPFVAIDQTTVLELIPIIKQWQKQNKIVVVVLHDYQTIRDFFPETILLARKCIHWGETEITLQEKNVKEANLLSQNWRFH